MKKLNIILASVFVLAAFAASAQASKDKVSKETKPVTTPAKEIASPPVAPVNKTEPVNTIQPVEPMKVESAPKAKPRTAKPLIKPAGSLKKMPAERKSK